MLNSRPSRRFSYCSSALCRWPRRRGELPTVLCLFDGLPNKTKRPRDALFSEWRRRSCFDPRGSRLESLPPSTMNIVEVYLQGSARSTCYGVHQEATNADLVMRNRWCPLQKCKRKGMGSHSNPSSRQCLHIVLCTHSALPEYTKRGHNAPRPRLNQRCVAEPKAKDKLPLHRRLHSTSWLQQSSPSHHPLNLYGNVDCRLS